MEKWIVCKRCGHNYSKKLGRCPECGHMTPLGLKQILALALSLAAVTAAVTGFALGLRDRGSIDTASDTVSAYSSDGETTTDSMHKSPSVPESSAAQSVQSTVAPSSSKNSVSSEVKKPSESSKSVSLVKEEIENTVNADSPIKNASAQTEVKEDSVKVTLSAELVSLINQVDGESSLTEITEEDREYGITEVTENPDGSVTAVFTQNGYKRYKADLYRQTVIALKGYENNPDKPFIKTIRYNRENLSNILIVTDTQFLNSETDSEALGTAVGEICLLAYVYRAFIGESNPSVKAEIILDTSTVSITFPE